MCCNQYGHWKSLKDDAIAAMICLWYLTSAPCEPQGVQEDVENVTTCRQFGLLNLLNLQRVSGVLPADIPSNNIIGSHPILELTTYAGCDGCSPHSQKYQSGIQESTSTYSPPPPKATTLIHQLQPATATGPALRHLPGPRGAVRHAGHGLSVAGRAGRGHLGGAGQVAKWWSRGSF